MSNQESKVTIGVGKHASVTDFTTAPVSYKHLLPERHGFASPMHQPLRRTPHHPLNKAFAPLRGPLDLSRAIQLEQLLRGLSGNTGAAIDPETTTDVAEILDTAAGTDSIDPAGAVTTATGGTGATPNLTVTSGTNIPNGMVLMFQAPLGTFHVRQVRSGGGTGTLVLDRTYSGAVAVGSNVIRLARWKFDPSVAEHVHAGFFVEYEDDRRIYLGGMCTWEMDFAVGAVARLITSWMFTDVDDEAEANPTMTEPTAGSGLVNVNNSFWVGSDLYYATDMRVVGGGTMSPRRANAGPHGILGYPIQKGGEAPRDKLVVTLQRGTNTGEVADSTGTASVNRLQAWDKASGEAFREYDIAFQVGGAAGAVGYGVMQAAVCTKADEVMVDGRKHLACEFEAMGPSSTTFAPFEFHLG